MMSHQADSNLTICAIIAVRNEYSYLRRLLPLLATQHIDVVIIDNDSSDGSDRLFEQFSGQPIIAVERLPYRGAFSLTEQLVAKRALGRSLTHDWLIHQDADEIFEHRKEGRTLRQAIEEADADGYNALNFDEFVFLPEPGQDYATADYETAMRQYYYFCPVGNHLNRAWKRMADLDNTAFGGHRLTGANLRLAPTNHIKRHYMVLSEALAVKKYAERSFSAEDLAKGWHRRRQALTPESLKLPAAHSNLLTLPTGSSRAFRYDRPTSDHYWAWQPEKSRIARVTGWLASLLPERPC